MAAGDPAGVPLAPSAARRLGLEPDVAPDAAQRTILRRLRDAEFLPDPVTHAAVMLFYGRPAEGASLLADDGPSEEVRLREDVEAFAARFFDMPPCDRRRRWQALVQACAGREGLLDRLRGLTLGLDVDRSSLAGRSPTETRLADDLCTLFVLRPGPRAALSRDLARRFRSDPSLTDRERARARRELRRRYPKVAALSYGYLAQLAGPRRPLRAARYRERVAVFLNRDFRSRRGADVQTAERTGINVWLIAAVVISVLGRIVTMSTRTSTPSHPPAVVSPAVPPQLLLPPGAKPSPVFARHLRDQFKPRLGRELEKLGKRPDEPALQKVVDAIPADAVPSGTFAAYILSGQWTQQEHDRCVAGLKKALVRSGLGLTEREIDAVAHGSIPKVASAGLAGRPGKTPARTPGALRRKEP